MSNTPVPGPELHPDWLRVPLGPGHGHADFHYRWLRHNCDRERHPRTGERTLCSSELPDDLSPRTAALTGDALEIEWAPDGHRSAYPLAWLRAHAYAVNRVAPPPPSNELAQIVVDGTARWRSGSRRRSRGCIAAAPRWSGATPPTPPRPSTPPSP